MGVIATFALLPVWLTSKKNKARLQWKGSLKGRRRGSFCKGLHISKVIPFSLPLSATNDLHDAARIQFHIYLFDILYHYWRHYCFSTPVSLTRFLSPPPASHLFFHSAPTYFTPLVTLKNKYIHAITARSPGLLMMRYLERKRDRGDRGSDCNLCAKHRNAARRGTQHCLFPHRFIAVFSSQVRQW